MAQLENFLEKFESILDDKNFDPANFHYGKLKFSLQEDWGTAYKHFNENIISSVLDIDLENLGCLCAYAIKSKNKAFLSWCLYKLTEIVNSTTSSNLNEAPTLDELNNDYVMLLVWFLRKVFYIQETQPSDCIFHHEFRLLEKDKFSFNLSAASSNDIVDHTFVKFVPFASKTDTRMLATNKAFIESYQEIITSKDSKKISQSEPLNFPDKFESLWNESQNPKQVLLLLLQDYVKLPYASASTHIDRFFRVIYGQWNQHHVSTVRAMLISNSLETIFYLPPTFDSLEYLLEGLRNRLILERETINPAGTLAKIITFVQDKAGKQIINIDELNQAIINNKKQNLFSRIEPNPHEVDVRNAVKYIKQQLVK